MRKILILTQPLGTNYGGLLQTFALQKTIKRLFAEKGKDVIVETDEHTSPVKENILKKNILFFYRLYKGYVKNEYLYRKNLFNDNIYLTKVLPILSQNTSKFVKENISTTQFFSNKYPNKSKIDEYDTYIVGSDQVFRPTLVDDIRIYFLDFLKGKDVVKIAYAASFGLEDEREFSSKDIEDCKILVSNFTAISLRETSGVDICKRCFNIDSECVLDPTMLLTKEDYESVIEEGSSRKTVGKIAYYLLDENVKKITLLKYLEQKTSLSSVSINSKEKPNSKTIDYTNCIYPSVSDWLSGIRDCEYVITDSFHGMVFSIIFKKNFYVIYNEGRGNARIDSLTKILGLEDRVVQRESQILVEDIDYTRVYDILNCNKQNSLTFLKTNLNI